MTEDKKNQLLNEIAGYFSPNIRHLISLLPGKAVGEMSENTAQSRAAFVADRERRKRVFI